MLTRRCRPVSPSVQHTAIVHNDDDNDHRQSADVDRYIFNQDKDFNLDYDCQSIKHLDNCFHDAQLDYHHCSIQPVGDRRQIPHILVCPQFPETSSLTILTCPSGDSYSQTGFDPTQQLASASNPLGNPTLPGYTTSGGPNWIGYYITQFNSSPVYSYNFASGGATTDANLVKPYASTVLSLVDQVTQYENSAKTIPGFVEWTAVNSLFAIWIGVNVSAKCRIDQISY